MIRVLIVDDSPLVRTIIRDFLENDESFTVVGEAENGLEALQKARELAPDLITMDLEMPVINGLEAIEGIMKTMNIPIVVIAAKDTAKNVYEATVKGALDFFAKVNFTTAISEEKQTFIRSSLKRISGIKARQKAAVTPEPPPNRKVDVREIRGVVIAASTGGPKALMSLCAALPADFPVPVVLVQHNSSGFDAGFVQWLDDYTPLKVKLAEEPEAPEGGKLYVAPTDKHLTLTGGRFLFDDREPVNNQKPSADILFKSAAKCWGAGAISVVLTGMGADGAEGTRYIRQAGGITIAQDEGSSMIYGMPKAAFETGCVDIVLPLEKIPQQLIDLIKP
ncbi:MAG: chemotaxis-specific protein-glutamate methyltransferase CheB [Spirochaetaceae bacterium]|jgi:two-component system chemotaxis response regulator CheB|nr:chemotaxis-specific protein-glutamate methyltransferase CheB [Spirochaetaceae bacterium]